MNSTNKRLLIFGLIVVTIVVTYYYATKTRSELAQARAENKRLLDIVLKNYSAISVPAESILVYQELEVSRVCKIAEVTKLFSTDRAPEDVCELVFLPLKSEGWKSSSWCRVMTYPFKRAPIDGDLPSYTFTRGDAGSPSKHFLVGVAAQPKNAWSNLFMLSPFGEEEAIPLARKKGRTFFTVKLYYSEDSALFKRHCPENSPRCDCVERSLFAWKFADGREFSSSN